MIYITVKQSPMHRQMSLEEFLFGAESKWRPPYDPNMTNTRTYEVENLGEHFKKMCDVGVLIKRLRTFNEQTEELRSKPRRDLYREFHIPKKSGGFRTIDAPEPELMDALRRLKTIFENDFHALYHTSAFAYIKNRSVVDCLKRHQENESKWFGKYDLSNFFGSTTMDFVLHMFSMVFPFSEVMRTEEGKQELEKALELAFLDGGLPQGTPISPTITNIMMIPVDFKIANELRDHNGQRYVYTRYADDFQVSSKYTFSFREIEQLIKDTLNEFQAPFKVNEAKTRYGSSAGSNYNLGLLITKENKITVGSKKKRRFQAALSSFILDTLNGNPWSKEDVQVLEGQRNYFRMVEGEGIDQMVAHVGQKYNVNVVQMIKQQLRAS